MAIDAVIFRQAIADELVEDLGPDVAADRANAIAVPWLRDGAEVLALIARARRATWTDIAEVVWPHLDVVVETPGRGEELAQAVAEVIREMVPGAVDVERAWGAGTPLVQVADRLDRAARTAFRVLEAADFGDPVAVAEAIGRARGHLEAGLDDYETERLIRERKARERAGT